MPCGQGSHAVSSAFGRSAPESQTVHPSALALGTSPAGHVEHSAVPGVSAKVPAGQSRQSASVVCSAALVPASLRYVPAGHCAQLAWPVVLVYSPAA